MGGLLSYSIAAGITLLVLYIVYKWMLASENQPRLNRIALMSIYTVSFILPLLPKVSLHSILNTHSIGTYLTETTLEAAISHSPSLINDDGFNWMSAILWIYGIGIFVFMTKTLSTAIKLYKLVRSGRKNYLDNYTVVYTDRTDIAPFSWGKYVVMNVNEESANAQMIEVHETAHIKARHFIDLLISQFICILLWYNPTSWLMQAELKAVHEYEADENVLKSGVNAHAYQLLLVKKAVGLRFPSLANSLNHSKLKKRMTMMYSKKTSAARKSRVLALVPAAVLGLALLNVPTVSEAMAFASTANLSISSISKNKVTTNSADEQTATENVVQKPEKLPEFKGGDAALMEFLMRNLKYPKEAEAANIQGNVIVEFTITKDGKVDDAKVMRPVDPSLDTEAIRVINATSGKWTPGESNGEKVNVKYVLPITFKTK